MPIRLELGIEPGWNHNNYHDKTDPVVVARFIDEKSGKVIFRYAPRFDDIQFWIAIFEAISKYELSKRANKNLHGACCDKKVQTERRNCLAGTDTTCKEKICSETNKTYLS